MGLKTTKYKPGIKYVILSAAAKVAVKMKYVYLLLHTFLLCMCVYVFVYYNINQGLSLVLCYSDRGSFWWLRGTSSNIFFESTI
jgi:hypothetical protein